ncbi:hypothetical protein ABDK56_12685 [Sphingomonas sp. ASV193]
MTMRGLVVLVVLLILLVGGAWFLSGRARPQPVHTIETNVTANAA